MKQYQKTLLIWLVFCLFIVSVWSYFSQNVAHTMDKPFSDVISSLEKGEIKEITVAGQQFSGEFKDGTRFRSTGERGEAILNALKKANQEFQTQYRFESEDAGGFWFFIAQWLPMILIMGILFFFMRQMQVGGGKAFSFGKSRARMVPETKDKITFASVAGVDECKQELEEIVQFLKDPKRFTKLGGRIPKGVLLMGPPGTGKTLLARAIAGEAGVPFFSIAGSDFVEMFVGVGASRVRDLFEQGKKNAPCIVFIDEIDAVGRQRGAGMGGGHDEREQTLNQLLVEMDGFESNEGVIIIAATNRPDVLDPAILRPGRFDRRVVVPRPDLLGREAIFKVHTKKVPLELDVNIEVLARSTPGMSGADIENLVNEAALIAARHDKEKVAMLDFEMAREKIMMGAERRTMVMAERELENTAHHEAGHALVSLLIGTEVDPVHKVTIIPRGHALGVTMSLPTEDRYSMTKTYAENQIAILLGGRIAEELSSGELTSGAGNDFEKASELARRMVCEWGMSIKMGPIVYGHKESEVFLGRDFSNGPEYSEQTAQEIDAEVRRLILEQYARARALLETHVVVLKKVARALLDYETLAGEEIKSLLAGNTLVREKPSFKIKTKENLEKERLNAASVTESAEEPLVVSV
ncbi:MAG: ATP-dependent zinc metalloprotease FtsH [Myxococcaceae bacterium]|nr:ATP-dependent zinc metalloprotease FtsH [Myxococcaceae bacterium]MBH2006718.1 ATP-dependent zinc metalloprotease FtsH [Myxococcaceae bacterium]